MSLVTIQQVNEAIMFGDFTHDQINSIIHAIKYRRAQMVKHQARILQPGDSVRFTSRGQVYYGTLTRMKIKNAVVRVSPSSTFNVPMSMLEAA